MKHTEKTNFITGAAMLAAANLVCKVLGVLFRVYAIRIMGEDGMFYYEKVYPIYSWLLIISSSGIPIAISRMVAARVARGMYEEADKLFKKAFWMLFALGVATTAFMIVLSQPIAVYVLDSHDEGMRWALCALAPALFFTSLLCAYRGYLQGLQRMEGTSLSQLAEQIFKMLFGLSLAWYLFRRYSNTPFAAAAGSVGVLLGVTISEALALAVIYPIFRKERSVMLTGFDPSNPAEEEKHILKGLLAIAIPITLGASILPIANVLDSAMITRLLIQSGYPEPEADWMYVVLCSYVRSIINLPAGISTSLSMAVVPAISASVARRETEDTKKLSAMSVKLAMAIGLPCAVGLSVLARPAIFLLYRHIQPESLDLASSLMHIAAFTVVFISLSQTVTGALQGVGRHRLPVYFLALGGLTKVIVNIVYVSNPRIGIYGAVFSNLACYGVAAILDTIALVVVTKGKLPFLDTFLKPALASALMGGAAWGVYHLLGMVLDMRRYLFSTAACILAIIVAIVFYLVLVLRLRVFTKDELTRIPGGKRLIRYAKH